MPKFDLASVDLSEAQNTLRQVQSALDCAESCETVADYRTNLDETLEHLSALQTLVKGLRKAAR